ncbi:hypothetical protein [Mongoliitalea daihaiensis]|uniref:hypothetical protein n=1 Tax=Mongoliitalea daihaiensis TaxID=2782006 RepID=UPI001F412FFD|nr:hypothetical protein [Mongoliitalea daihaiensis]UJP66369.1 hypothetical protein IPZ59_07135 [Mongoliitalea daihaiensis]
MLSFFKINDPFRLFAVLGLMLLMSTVYIMVLRVPITQPELIWMLLGERLAQGGHMYVDVIDNTAPLSAGVYWFLHWLFGKNLVVHQVIATVIICFQIIYINNLFFKFRTFDENSYIPALIMGILFHSSFDFIRLTPMLMGSTFLILAVGQLFSQTVLQKESTSSVLLVGLYFGIAACFHFPLVVFLPYLVVVGVAIGGYNLSQLILSLVGYFLPLACAATYYFWIGGFQDFISEFLLTSKLEITYKHIGLRDFLILMITPLFFTTMGIVYGSFFKSLTVNQQKQLQLMLIFLLTSVAVLFLSNRHAPFQLVVFIPPMVYFISLLFVANPKGVLMNVLVYVFLLGVPLTGMVWVFQEGTIRKNSAYLIQLENRHAITKGKKVLVLGTDLAYYQDASLATPFLNYYHSRELLTNYTDLSDMADVYQAFKQELPEVVIDEEGIFQALLGVFPEFQERYTLEKRGVYVLK